MEPESARNEGIQQGPGGKRLSFVDASARAARQGRPATRAVLAPSLLQDASFLYSELPESGQDDERAAAYMAEFAHVHPFSTAYSHVPQACRAMLATLTVERGQDGVEQFLRRVILHAILSLPERLAHAHLPASVVEHIGKTVAQAIDSARSPRQGYFRHENDAFTKALAICRLRLLPCGVEMFDVDASLSRSALWTSGLAGGVDFARALVALGGHKPFLMGHWDRHRIREFSADGYRRMYCVAADLLDARPEFIGIGGRSWWFDPALASISPELGFLRETEAAGAFFVPTATDASTTAQALSFSRQRSAAHAEGRYTPRSYMWIWPRAAVLAWRTRYEAELEAADDSPVQAIHGGR